MNELTKIFGQPQGNQRFDLIRISIACPSDSIWSSAKSKSQKPSTTAHSSQNVTVYLCDIRPH